MLVQILRETGMCLSNGNAITINISIMYSSNSLRNTFKKDE